MRCRLLEAESHLGEAVKILHHEPADSTYGELAANSQQSLQQLGEYIASVKSM